MLKKYDFAFCLLLSGWDIPLLFWEEEGRRMVEDFVGEEEKLYPLKQGEGKKQRRRSVKRTL